MKLRTLVAGAVLALTVVATESRPARAADAFDGALLEARSWFRKQRWDKTEAAVRKLLDDFAGDERVLSEMRDIEEMLQTSLFWQSRGPFTPAEIYGDSVTGFDARKQTITFEYDRPEGDLWEHPKKAYVFNVALEAPITIRYEEGKQDTYLVICFDAPKKGGYVVTPGIAQKRHPVIARFHEYQDGKFLATGDARRLKRVGGPVTVERLGSAISVRRGSEVCVRGSDSKYRSGQLMFIGGRPSKLRITGKVLPKEHDRRVDELAASQREAWEKTNYDRKKELPRWVNAHFDGTSGTTTSLWPSDVPEKQRAELDQALAKFLAGKRRPFAGLTSDLPDRTGLYIAGLAALDSREFDRGAERLDELIALEPGFAPARLFRGIARLRQRKIDAAELDLEHAVATVPQFLPAHIALAQLHVFGGDLESAHTVLEHAASVGHDDEYLDRLRGAISRAREGPRWNKTYEHETKHFIVRSNHAQGICYDIAEVLEKHRAKYAKELRVDTKPSKRKSVVHVFGTRAGYVEYGAERLSNLGWTAGVFLPATGEMLLWMPSELESLWDTVRHEGFHWFLNQYTESAPTWFNEGYAQFFGASRATARRENRGKFLSIIRNMGDLHVRDLMTCDHATFIGKASLNYPLSDELVLFLRDTKDDRFKGKLHAYRRITLDGASAESAFEMVFEEVADELNDAFRDHLIALYK